MYWRIFSKIFVSATEFCRSNKSHKFCLIWFLRRGAATNLFCGDKDFHKNSSAHTKQFVTVMCRRNLLLQLVAYCVPTLNICGPGGRGGIPDFKWQGWSNGGKNQNPKKSHADFPSHKNFQSNYTARTCGSYHESSDCFEYPKKSLIISSHPKKYLVKFSYPNKIPKSKISNPKKSFNHPCHLKFRAPPPLLGHGPSISQVDTFCWSQDWLYKVAVTLSSLLIFFLIVKMFSNVVIL